MVLLLVCGWDVVFVVYVEDIFDILIIDLFVVFVV